jgi:hypothetical protein
MQLNQIILFLYNWDTINYPNERCSVRTIARIPEAKGCSVVAIETLTNVKRPFAEVIGDVLLIIHPPPPWQLSQLSQQRWRATAGPTLPVPHRVTQTMQHWMHRTMNPVTTCPSPTTPTWTRISRLFKKIAACLETYLVITAGGETNQMRTPSSM